MGKMLNMSGAGVSAPSTVIFKGVISVAADFPDPTAVKDSDAYRITASVTDDDASKTNTGQSFLDTDEIYWNGTNWSIMGQEAHITGDGTDHLQVATNKTHVDGNGADHANVALNDTHRASNGTDHSIVNAITTFAKTLLDDVTAAAMRTTLGLGSLSLLSSINNINWSGTDLAVVNGGTGTSTGSITGTGALTFTAGGSNQNVNITPSGTGITVVFGNLNIGDTIVPVGRGNVFTLRTLAGDVTTTPANAACIYTKTVAGWAEIHAIDEAENITQISPHPTNYLNSVNPESKSIPYGYVSKNDFLGEEVFINLAELAEEVEKLTGRTDLIITKTIPKKDWDITQQGKVDVIEAKITEREEKISNGEDPEKLPVIEPYSKKEMPLWMKNRIVFKNKN